MSMNDPLEKRPHDATHATTATPCTCHRETGSHEQCCGHEQGHDSDCPIHGDGYTILAW
jgi:hypothetical protein